MDKIRNVRFRWLRNELGEVSYELSRATFTQVAHPQGWQPAVNAYLCDCSIRICFDLAGVDRSDINLTVEPLRVLLRGVRQPPEPSGPDPRPRRILMMEIDYGPFVREIRLPAPILPEEVTAEQKNGLLWVNIPLCKSL